MENNILNSLSNVTFRKWVPIGIRTRDIVTTDIQLVYHFCLTVVDDYDTITF